MCNSQQCWCSQHSHGRHSWFDLNIHLNLQAGNIVCANLCRDLNHCTFTHESIALVTSPTGASVVSFSVDTVSILMTPIAGSICTLIHIYNVTLQRSHNHHNHHTFTINESIALVTSTTTTRITSISDDAVSIPMTSIPCTLVYICVHEEDGSACGRVLSSEGRREASPQTFHPPPPNNYLVNDFFR